MGAGNFSSPSSPARMDAWSLSQLGWVTLAPLATSGTYSFGAAPTSDTAFLVRPTGANPRGEYFLLENRQAVDADSALIRNACQVWYQAATPPGCSGGLLAWHVDSQQIAQHGFESGNALNAGPIHGLELLQADARGNLDANPNPPCTSRAAGCADAGDVGDPYPGVTQNPTLALFTTPNTALNSGACPGVGIDSITQVVPNGALRFVLRIGGDSLAVATAPRLVGARWGYSYSVTLAAACGAGSYSWVGPDSGAVPPGLTVSATGVVSGAPADSGTYAFRVSVTDGTQTAHRTLTLQVVEPTLTLQQVLDLGFQGPLPVSGDDRRRYLDLQGNANGTFDIGDVARWLARTGNRAAPVHRTVAGHRHRERVQRRARDRPGSGQGSRDRVHRHDSRRGGRVVRGRAAGEPGPHHHSLEPVGAPARPGDERWGAVREVQAKDARACTVHRPPCERQRGRAPRGLAHDVERVRVRERGVGGKQDA